MDRSYQLCFSSLFSFVDFFLPASSVVRNNAIGRAKDVHICHYRVDTSLNPQQPLAHLIQPGGLHQGPHIAAAKARVSFALDDLEKELPDARFAEGL